MASKGEWVPFFKDYNEQLEKPDHKQRQAKGLGIPLKETCLKIYCMLCK